MNSPKAPFRVVIVGGGFAGIEVAKKLLSLGVGAQITLISQKMTFEYFPALYKLVTGALAIEASIPLEKIFNGNTVKLIEASYESLEPAQNEISIAHKDGSKEKINYDYLVLAMGSETNYFNIKGLPEFSFSFKSVTSALALKQHFCDLFSKAQEMTKEDMIAALHVIVVGAGPSGVELAGDLRSYLTRVAKDFSIDPSLVTIDLIEAANRVLPTFPASVSVKAESRLRKMGVNIFLNRALLSQETEEIILNDMEMGSKTVIWTAGTKINSNFITIKNIELDKRKKVIVSAFLSLPDSQNIFVVGDGAATKFSGVAQTAIRDGKYVARRIRALINKKQIKPYKAKQPAFVVPIGINWAIFNYKNFVMTGFGPWILRSLIDFRYFSHLLSVKEAISVFRKGKKYKKINGGCSVDALVEE